MIPADTDKAWHSDCPDAHPWPVAEHLGARHSDAVWNKIGISDQWLVYVSFVTEITDYRGEKNIKTTQVEIPLGVQSWGQRPGCEASRASHCPSGQERGCKKIFSAQLSVCCFNISTCWLINIIRQVCSILKLMEPLQSRCRRRRAAWTWWRSWTLAQSSGKPHRWEGGVQSCTPPCFDIMDMMYILIIDGGHFWYM